VSWHRNGIGIAEEWVQYVNILTHNAIKLPNEEDQIKWSKNFRTWEHTGKLGYSIRLEENMDVERV